MDRWKENYTIELAHFSARFDNCDTFFKRLPPWGFVLIYRLSCKVVKEQSPHQITKHLHIHWSSVNRKEMESHFQKMFSFNILLILLLFSSSEGFDGKCERITVPECRSQYNYTHIPNELMGLESQIEAALRVKDFEPLIKINCAPLLKFFICSMFVPMCFVKDGVPTAIYACRPMCEQAKIGCEPVMKRYGFTWPENLACERLPWVSTSSRICMTAPKLQNWKGSGGPKIPQKGNKSVSFKERCIENSKFLYIGDKEKEICAPKCNASISFNQDDKKFADAWITTWSVICFISTLLTVSTFLIDSSRFRYPERPIIFLSMCYNIYSVGYLIRAFAGRDKIVCENSVQGKHLVYDGMSNTACTIVFFFTYFFGMASAIWWVILALTWFLSAALKWGHEAVEKYSSVFHAIAWAIPTVQTIVALVTRKVDPDELTGLCYIGNRSSITLLWFVVIPLFVYLLLGTSFLLTGFISLLKIRRTLRRETNTQKLEKLMLRIGIFSVLYTIPAGFVVACFLGEYFKLKKIEQHANDIITCYEDSACRKQLKPDPGLLYLKHFMLLVVGVTSGVFIWSTKTLTSWKKVYNKCCRKNNNNNSKLQPKRVPNTSRNGHNIAYYQTSIPPQPQTVQNPVMPIQTMYNNPVSVYPVSLSQGSGKSMPFYTTAHSVVSHSMSSQPVTGCIQSNQGYPVPLPSAPKATTPRHTSTSHTSTSHSHTSHTSPSHSHAASVRSDSEMGVITSAVRL